VKISTEKLEPLKKKHLFYVYFVMKENQDF